MPFCRLLRSLCALSQSSHEDHPFSLRYPLKGEASSARGHGWSSAPWVTRARALSFLYPYTCIPYTIYPYTVYRYPVYCILYTMCRIPYTVYCIPIPGGVAGRSWLFRVLDQSVPGLSHGMDRAGENPIDMNPPLLVSALTG